MFSRPHLSWNLIEFHYGLTRRYPFRNFDWIVVVVLTALFILFTIFNVATVGYALQATTSTSPNTTESQRKWFNNAFFTWDDNSLNPKCQDVEISMGSQVQTSNRGLIYTVSGINGSCAPENGKNNMQCPLSYHSQKLANCHVVSISIYLTKTDLSKPANTYWWSWGLSYSSAKAECDVTTSKGTHTLKLDVVYPGRLKVFDFLVVDDFDRSRSLWWGSRLMDDYLTGVRTTLTSHGNESLPTWTSGQMDFRVVNTQSMYGSASFEPDFWMHEASGGILNSIAWQNEHVKNIFEDHSFPLHSALTEGLFFAKTFVSTILVDLGQDEDANLLLDEKSLQYALDPDDDFNRQPNGSLYDVHNWNLDWYKIQGITPGLETPTRNNSILMAEAYEAIPKAPLGTQPATFYFQYSCLVPTKRSVPSTVMLVLISDFVLINISWTIIKFFAGRFVATADPNAMYCEGCLSRCRHTEEGKPMQQHHSKDVQTTSTTSHAAGSSDVFVRQYESSQVQEPLDSWDVGSETMRAHRPASRSEAVQYHNSE